MPKKSKNKHMMQVANRINQLGGSQPPLGLQITAEK